VANSFTYVSHKETGYFSNLVTDYISEHEHIQPFYRYSPNAEGLAKAIEDRSKYPVNRQVLVNTLRKQYEQLTQYPKAKENIQLLLSENTFTVCTAHQPNLLTGYLYFVYKILHAIKLAGQLGKLYPEKNFVPVFYIGSEDNDIEELGTFRFGDKKFVWGGEGQKGAVGRMKTKGLKPILNELFKLFGPPGKNCEVLESMLTEAYLKHDTIAVATQYLVNELFGQYGLVVLNPDEKDLKASFIPVMEDELLQGKSHTIVSGQIEKLAVHYKVQAQPRPINLFYLADNLRERIERKNDVWELADNSKKWSAGEIIAELKQNPERFSPNVVLRGLYQETILPNVAFVGGGAEVAYWLQLKTLFAHYNVFYPCIYLRQSVLWTDSRAAKLRQQLGFSVMDIFKPLADLEREYVSSHTTDDWKTDKEAGEIEQIFAALKKKATATDPTLAAGADASLAKMKYQLIVLEKKMLRAEKKKMQTQVLRIRKLKDSLFPRNSLQERVENFSPYYLLYGKAFFDTVLEGIEPIESTFLVVEKES
jgi:bacillithiol synthase